MYSEYLDVTKIICAEDPDLAKAMDREFERQGHNIELIASENIVSPAVLAAMGSVLTNKYAEGYPGRRYYGGCEFVDEVETLAISRAKKLFGADHANVQAHSGAQANMAAYSAILEPGDSVLGMSLAHGGHLTHGSPFNASGKLYDFSHYGVDEKTGYIDYGELERITAETRPRLIVAGASAYPRVIDFARVSEIAKKHDALFMVDMAHIAGLVATGQHPSPIPYADIVTSTTHKTLRGPRGGLILCKEEFAKAVDKAIFPGMQGGPLMHIIAAKAVCFHEAMGEGFRKYQAQVVRNAAALADGLLRRGVRLVSDGTDNHLMLLNLTGSGVTGRDLEQRLDMVHITTNKNAIPGDLEKPTITSGLRLGSPAVTTRGFMEAEMDRIAGWIHLAITDFENSREAVTREVVALCEQYPIYR